MTFKNLIANYSINIYLLYNFERMRIPATKRAALRIGYESAS